MSALDRKAFSAAPTEPGDFVARIWVINGPPDADADIELPKTIKDGHPVVVSDGVGDHSAIYGRRAAVGEARLFETDYAAIAAGRIDDSSAGLALRRRLREQGEHTEWSVAWTGLKARAPNASELERWPDVRRVIVGWNPIEISPVARGACGPACRTLSAKCAGACACGGKHITPEPAPRPADLEQWIPGFRQEAIARRVIAVGRRRWGVKSLPTIHFFRPNGRCSGQALLDREPKEIWIASGLDDEQTALTALHELWHVDEADHYAPARNEFAAEAMARRLLPEIDDPRHAGLNFGFGT